MRAFRSILLAASLMSAPMAATAASDQPKRLFASDDMLHLTIQGPIGRIASNRSSNAPPIPATLGANGETLPITLSARGITRKATDICQFPPLRVEFPQPPGDGSLFKGQKKLKLVTHCKTSEGFQQYVLMEYAAYRMFNLLSPIGIRPRLATIDYVDPSGKPVITRFGFFLEEASDVAKRNGLKSAKTGDRVPPASLSSPEAGRAAMFEYMIGNLDWAMMAGPVGTGCCHNFKLLSRDGTASPPLVPVPYDYDFSGLVNAPYATPPAGITVANVRVRRYRGFCRNNADAQAAAADMVAKRAAIEGVLSGIPQMDNGTRQRGLSYLAEFFEQAATPDGVSRILKGCLA